MPSFETGDGCSLHYRDWGHGAPVVFLHGWGLGADMWEYQMPALVARGLRCIALDARGCGRSDDPGRGYDFDTLADDLCGLLDHLRLDGATLVAHSMASGTVARYLSRHGSSRVARVVLVAPIRPWKDDAEDAAFGLVPEVFEAMRAALARDRAAFMRAGAEGFFGRGTEAAPVTPAILDWGVGLAMGASPLATLRYVECMSGGDLRGDLASFTMPTLVIHGDQDQSTPLPLTGRRFADGIDGARLVVYEGASHGLFFTEKERLNRDIAEFAGA